MISPDPLDRLVEQDTFAEMLALLEPEEMVVAALRLEGLPDSRIAALLDSDPRLVSQSMEDARLRIMEAVPELASFLRGRQRPGHWPLSRQPPLERGWLCRWDEDEEEPSPELDAGLTVQEVARRCGVTEQTVSRWVREGCFPNAYRVNPGGGAYRIPEQDLLEVRPGRRNPLARRPGKLATRTDA